MNKQYARELISQNKESYEKIAEDFSRTRKELWEELYEFKQFVAEGDSVLDVGCGNGRLVQLFKNQDIDYTGVDLSRKLIEIAQQKHPHREFLQAGLLGLPFVEEKFDTVFAIAVLHHIPSRPLRIKSLSELYRVLKSKGTLVLTVWKNPYCHPALFQFKGWIKKIFTSWSLDPGDYIKEWGGRAEMYYHFFTHGELISIVQEVGFNIIDSGCLQSADGQRENIYVIAQK